MKAGTLKVAGLLLPERAASLRGRSAWAVPTNLDEALADGPELVVLDLRGASDDMRSRESLELARRTLTDRVGRAEQHTTQNLTVVLLASRALAAAVIPESSVLVNPFETQPGKVPLAVSAPAHVDTSVLTEEGAR
jgi:RND superfamily putative drug exporter